MRHGRASSRQDTELPTRKGWRKISKAKLGIGLGAVAVAVSVLVPANAAHATDQSCARFGNFGICLLITGGGAYVSEMYADVHNYNGVSEPYVHTELIYPDGALVKNGPTQTIPAGRSGAPVQWNPNSNVPTGNYEAVAWQWSSQFGYQVVAYVYGHVA